MNASCMILFYIEIKITIIGSSLVILCQVCRPAITLFIWQRHHSGTVEKPSPSRTTFNFLVCGSAMGMWKGDTGHRRSGGGALMQLE